MLALPPTLQNGRAGRDLREPCNSPISLLLRKLRRRGGFLSRDTYPVGSRARIRPQVFSLRLVHFVSFWWLKFLSGFTCAVIICRSSSLTSDAQWLLLVPWAACRCFLDVACGHWYLNAAVTGLWYHHPLIADSKRTGVILKRAAKETVPKTRFKVRTSYLMDRKYFTWDQSR